MKPNEYEMAWVLLELNRNKIAWELRKRIASLSGRKPKQVSWKYCYFRAGEIERDVTLLHRPEFSGSGQIGICVKCRKPPSKEGHDGCLGTLKDKTIMNACCGHGEDSTAYIQYRISGKEAIAEQRRLIQKERRDGRDQDDIRQILQAIKRRVELRKM